MEKFDYNVVGVIPARYQSRRLPFKLLRRIGAKTVLQYTWESVKAAHKLDRVLIAYDDIKIKEAAEEFGAEVILTSREHKSGTDRVADSVNNINAKIIINIQADEPLIHPSVIDDLAQVMISDAKTVMATAKTKIYDSEEINDLNTVKVVTDRENCALYFSRFPIPCFRDNPQEKIYYKHLGIYAYTREFLYIFKNLPPSVLEKAEQLEQLRALDAGFKIKVIETQFDSLGVDTEADFKKVEKILQKRERRLC